MTHLKSPLTQILLALCLLSLIWASRINADTFVGKQPEQIKQDIELLIEIEHQVADQLKVLNEYMSRITGNEILVSDVEGTHGG